MNTLQFLLPNLDRKNLIYWDTATRKSVVVDTEKLFECGNDVLKLIIHKFDSQ